MTKTYKVNRKPSGVGHRNRNAECKAPNGRRPVHTPVPEPHPSIPSITRNVCTGCGAVIDWKAS